MSYRPQRATGADANHYIPRDYLRDRCGGFQIAPKEVRGSTMAYTANFRGWKILLIDMSKYGGVLPDWYIESARNNAWVEVKTPEAYKAPDLHLTDGEKWLEHNAAASMFVIKDDEGFEQVLEHLVKGTTP